jgi:uncharacterized cupredoxin-like copper-binding protein
MRTHPNGRTALAALAAVVLAAVLAVALTASRRASARTDGPTVAVTERDFHIATDASVVHAGAVTLRIHNAGPDQHELIVLPLHHGEAPGALPLRPDGFTVDEEALQSQEPGAIDPQRPGGTEDLTVHLVPGRYVLFCNMSGHYMAGMHRLLEVVP